MNHSKDLEKKYEYVKHEHSTLQTVHHKVSKDLDLLKKKEREFNESIARRLEMQHEFDAVSAERNKLLGKLEKTDANNAVLEAEITVIKKEILREKKIQQDLRDTIDDIERKAQREKAKIQEMEIENGENVRNVERLTN